MSAEAQHVEFPYTLKIETLTGHTVTVPIAFLTREQVARFLQTDFKKLAQESGMKGARVHVEQAVCANYENVVQEVGACFKRAALRAG